MGKVRFSYPNGWVMAPPPPDPPTHPAPDLTAPTAVAHWVAPWVPWGLAITWFLIAIACAVYLRIRQDRLKRRVVRDQQYVHFQGRVWGQINQLFERVSAMEERLKEVEGRP